MEINEKDGPGGGYGLVGWPADQTLRVGGQVPISSLDHSSLTLLFHQVANIEVKLAWQDNRLATTEISLNSSHRIGSRESVESADSMTLSDNSGRPLLEASSASPNSLTPSHWAAAGGLSCSAQFDRSFGNLL